MYIYREKEVRGWKQTLWKGKKKKTCCCWIYWALIATPELPSEWTPTSVTRVIVSKTRKRSRQTPDSRNQRHKKKREEEEEEEKKDLVAQADVSVLLTHMCVRDNTRRWTHTRPSPVFLAGLVSLSALHVWIFSSMFFFFLLFLFFFFSYLLPL